METENTFFNSTVSADLLKFFSGSFFEFTYFLHVVLPMSIVQVFRYLLVKCLVIRGM